MATEDDQVILVVVQGNYKGGKFYQKRKSYIEKYRGENEHRLMESKE